MSRRKLSRVFRLKKKQQLWPARVSDVRCCNAVSLHSHPRSLKERPSTLPSSPKLLRPQKYFVPSQSIHVHLYCYCSKTFTESSIDFRVHTIIDSSLKQHFNCQDTLHYSWRHPFSKSLAGKNLKYISSTVIWRQALELLNVLFWIIVFSSSVRQTESLQSSPDCQLYTADRITAATPQL